MRIDPRAFGETGMLDEVLSMNSNSSRDFLTEGESPTLRGDISKRNSRYNYDQE
jgi:hypothetical protein